MTESVPAKGRDRFRLPRWGQRGTAGASIPAQLTFEDVVKTYGEIDVLDQVSLTIAPGELVCLLGHSGCGKTTLLRIAAGVETPSSGRVLIDGQLASGRDGFIEPENRGIGLMFQDYALFPHMSVQQNVMFGLKGLSASEAAIAARRALSRVGLERYADEFPHTLSGGEQQRVALARSIAPRPGVLLMDEPFSNLDRRMRDAVRDETVAILRETGATTIVVTHDPEEAMRIADRIVLMRAGRIIQQGSSEELYSAPANLFAARFFCDFNEVPGEVRERPRFLRGGRVRRSGNCRWARGGLHPAAGPQAEGRRLLPSGPGRVAPLPWRSRSRPYRRAGRGTPAAGPNPRFRRRKGRSGRGYRNRSEGCPCFRRARSLGWPNVREIKGRAREAQEVVMGGASIWHWIVVGLIVVLLFGRGKISDMMGDVAKGIKAFKKGMSEEDAPEKTAVCNRSCPHDRSSDPVRRDHDRRDVGPQDRLIGADVARLKFFNVNGKVGTASCWT